MSVSKEFPYYSERIRHVLFTVLWSRPSSSLGTLISSLFRSVLLCLARFIGDVRRRGAFAYFRKLLRVTIDLGSGGRQTIRNNDSALRDLCFFGGRVQCQCSSHERSVGSSRKMRTDHHQFMHEYTI